MADSLFIGPPFGLADAQYINVFRHFIPILVVKETRLSLPDSRIVFCWQWNQIPVGNSNAIRGVNAWA